MASTSERVIECLDANANFIVEAGAGSGKTRTLVDALVHLLGQRASHFQAHGQQVVAITYTNVAAREIVSRINGDPLVRVSTIHDFLWSVVSPFQAELKAAIIAANEAKPARKKIADLDLQDTAIEYWQYSSKWQEGKVHHDDVVSLSAWLFQNYPKLARLVVDRFPIVFVDEYQDTHESTINLLLDVLAARFPERFTVGLFGDHMQKIYASGVGKVERADLILIQKTENYRSSKAVIEFLNRLRPELEQVPSGENADGSVKFIASAQLGDSSLQTVRNDLRNRGWTEESEKVLMLTRRGIAGDLEWTNLLAAYQKRGSFAIDDLVQRNDEFGESFAEIEMLCRSFADGRFGDYLAQRLSGERAIRRHSDKATHAREMAKLNELRDKASVGEVLAYAWGQGLVRKPSRVVRLEDRISKAETPERSAKDQEFRETLMAVPFAEVSRFEAYLDDETPFSTTHGVKGAEFQDVIVVINDKLWNMYRFESVLANDSTRTQFERSLNLFYVACSRARRHLVVLATSEMGEEAMAGARRLFGESNVTEMG
ncbi:UvrD-helicase domain-containing protein [Timonella senegalensis]|uniref:UvrD-helicase domain-containing protein n=1 Tax=Timonella senegalensis TaxID=1465825 RepID=UPI0028A868D9|nr:UvrD-helicase domain-containing protein [Timonella senegalensis]